MQCGGDVVLAAGLWVVVGLAGGRGLYGWMIEGHPTDLTGGLFDSREGRVYMCCS